MATINFIKIMKNHNLLVSALLVLYIVFNVKTTPVLADIISNPFGFLVVVASSVYLFSKTTPLLGVLILIAAYEFIVRSNKASGVILMNNYLPSEKKKVNMMQTLNQIPRTLEEDMVSVMAPITRDFNIGTPSFKPVMDTSLNTSNL